MYEEEEATIFFLQFVGKGLRNKKAKLQPVNTYLSSIVNETKSFNVAKCVFFLNTTWPLSLCVCAKFLALL